MSELVRLIDAYRDAHGQPSDASIARAIGVAPQTVSSWRKRGIRELPNEATLRQLADLLRVDYQDYVLQVALYDAGWRDDLPPEPNPLGRSVRQRFKDRGLAEYFDAEADDEADNDTPASGSA